MAISKRGSVNLAVGSHSCEGRRGEPRLLLLSLLPFFAEWVGIKGKGGTVLGMCWWKDSPTDCFDLANKILPHVEPWKAEGTEGEKSQHGCTQPTRSSESQIWKLFPEQAGPRVVSLTFLSLV